MKHVALLFCLLLARAGAATPADTLRGQAHFVRKLSAHVCDGLAEAGQKTDLSQLKGEEAEQLLTKLMIGAMSEQYTEYQALQKQVVGSNHSDELSSQIGQEAMMQLMTNCPAARPLVAKMGMSAAHEQAELPGAERQLLTPIAAEICRRLDAEDAKKPLASMAPESASSLMQGILGEVLLANTEQLEGYYGEDAMNDETKMHSIGAKIAMLLLEQCPRYLLLLGQDAKSTAAHRATPHKATPAKAKASAAKPGHRPVPRKTTPVRK